VSRGTKNAKRIQSVDSATFFLINRYYFWAWTLCEHIDDFWTNDYKSGVLSMV